MQHRGGHSAVQRAERAAPPHLPHNLLRLLLLALPLEHIIDGIAHHLPCHLHALILALKLLRGGIGDALGF